MSEQPSNDPEWLSTSHAARKLGMPVRHLYRLIDEGRVPAYKFGRVIRLRHDDIERLHDQG